jgi:hypothetical protein
VSQPTLILHGLSDRQLLAGTDIEQIWCQLLETIVAQPAVSPKKKTLTVAQVKNNRPRIGL